MRCQRESLVLRASGLPYISREQERAMQEQMRKNQEQREKVG